MNTQSKINMGVLGLGVISKYYLSALQDENNPYVKLAAVCSLEHAELNIFASEKIFSTNSMDALFQQKQINAVIINLPNDLHYTACRKALVAGLHVCCEKPLTLRLSEAHELKQIAKQNNLILLTAFHRRYNNNILQLKQRISEAAGIKKIAIRYFEKIEEHCGNNSWYLEPTRCGGGVIADNGPNALDLAVLFAGKLDINAVAIAYNKRGIDSKARILAKSLYDTEIDVQLDWAYTRGECKDVHISLQNGNHHYADMLQGYAAFKSSLFHEYVAILQDFIERIQHIDKSITTNQHDVDMVTYIEKAYQKSHIVTESYLDECFNY